MNYSSAQQQEIFNNMSKRLFLLQQFSFSCFDFISILKPFKLQEKDVTIFTFVTGFQSMMYSFSRLIQCFGCLVD